MVEVLDGEAVAQRMRADLFGEPGPLAGGAHDVLHAPHGDAAGFRFSGCTREEIIRRFFVAEVGDEVAAHGVVVGKRALFSALGLADDERSVVAVEVVQPDAANLPGAEAETEDQAEDEAVFGGGGGGEKLTQLTGSKQFTKLTRFARGGDGDDLVWPFYYFAEVVFKPADDGVQCRITDRSFAPGEELQNFFGGDRVDVAVDVVLQVADGATVGPDGAFRPSL